MSSQDCNKLCQLISEISSLNYSHYITAGDLNMPSVNWENMTTEGGPGDYMYDFVEIVKDSFWCQHIHEPTRGRGDTTPSLIDVLFSNEENMVSDVNINPPLGKSDHSLISFNFCGYTQRTSGTERLNYNKADFDKMKSLLDKDWHGILSGKDIDGQWEIFAHTLRYASQNCIPMRRTNTNRRNKNGIQLSRKLQCKLRRKERLWRKYRKNGEQDIYEQYKRVRNQVRRLSRDTMKKYEEDIAKSAKDNPKRFWSYVKSKSKTRASISNLYRNSDKTELTENESEIANVLGDFFSSVFTVEPDDDLPSINKKDVPTINNIEISIDTVRKKLEELDISKSPGPDNINPRILKEMSDILAEPIYIIFENSLRTGELPKEWKTAHISAIFKKGDKKEACNYRPVSLTCIICKLLEKIVRENMVKHMKMHNLFNEKQYGFISGRSTVLQLLAVIDDWTDTLDNGGSIDVAYCDYMKAFDKVSHRRLIHKLSIYGFGETYIKWITNFLSERKQKVIVNGHESTWKDVTSGIPQGSVLGPMLFVIFINDITENLKNDSQVYLYADDTKIYREIASSRDRELLQEDIYSMCEWSDKWLLKFHPDKCKTMTIGRTDGENRGYRLRPDLPPMEISDAEKDIGVVIDNKLAFNKHLAEKVKKANSVLGAIRRSFEYMDISTFKKLYTALVRPHIEYAHAVWSPYKKKDITTIENVQKRATKMVPGLSHLSYEERLRKIKLPTLHYRRIRGDMIEVFKLLNQKYYFDETTLLSVNTDSNTRGHSKKLYKSRARLDIRKFSFTSRVVDIWNSLPESVISAGTLITFEARLDRFWSNQDILYNFEATIATGGRNEEELVLEAE